MDPLDEKQMHSHLHKSSTQTRKFKTFKTFKFKNQNPKPHHHFIGKQTKTQTNKPTNHQTTHAHNPQDANFPTTTMALRIIKYNGTVITNSSKN
jgi:hypothetical protein